MPQKATLQSKLTAIHEYLVQSCTCFTLKELESTATYGTVKIRSADVKGLIKSLTDENLVQCEKIGSGNWYWASWTDPVLEKEKETQVLVNEKIKRQESVTSLQAELTKREELLRGMPMLVERAGQLSVELEEKKASFVALQLKLATMKSSDSMAAIDEKKKRLGDLEMRVEHWEDNLDVLKSYLIKLGGGDRTVVDQVLCSLGAADAGESELSERDAKRRRTE